MDRYDPLSQLAPASEAPVPESPPTKAPKRPRKQPPLLRAVAHVKDDTLAFLSGGPEQQAGDYQRNLERAGQIRQEFVAFCEANLHYTEWRQAWAAFMALQAPVAKASPQPVITLISPEPPATPRWKQRMRAVTPDGNQYTKTKTAAC